MSTENIWQMLDVALTLKSTRQATLGRLNQLLQKRFPHISDGYLTQDNCDVSRESLTPTQLQHYKPGHNEADPWQITGPVVVFEHEGVRYMFDGTNRLNVWLRDGDINLHDTIVVKRRAVSSDG